MVLFIQFLLFFYLKPILYLVIFNLKKYKHNFWIILLHTFLIIIEIKHKDLNKLVSNKLNSIIINNCGYSATKICNNLQKQLYYSEKMCVIILNYKINKMNFFVFSSKTVFYIVVKYLK